MPAIRCLSFLWFEPFNFPVQRNKKKFIVDLPIPPSQKVDSYSQDVAARGVPFNLSVGYVRRPAKGPTFEDPSYVDYDLELEDENWLRANSRFGERADVLQRLPSQTFERMIDLLERYSGERAQGTMDVVSLTDAIVMLGQALEATKERFPLPDGIAAGTDGFSKCVGEVYGYWTAKRTKLKKPLLRRYWPPTSATDNNPHHTFRPHEKMGGYKLRRTRRNDVEAFKRLQALRKDFSHTRSIIGGIKDREGIKAEVVALLDERFEQGLYDLVDTSGTKRPTPPIIAAFRERRKAKEEGQQAAKSSKLKLKYSKSGAQAAAAAVAAAQAGAGSATPPDGSGMAGAAGGDDGGAMQPSKKLRLKQQGRVGMPGMVPGAGAAVAAAAAPSAAVGGGVMKGQKGIPAAGGVAGVGAGAAAGPKGAAALTEDERRKLAIKQQRQRDAQAAQQQQAQAAATAQYARPPHAQYPGFRLGPWTPLQSLQFNGSYFHCEEGAYEPEDPLDLARAYGLRLGVANTPAVTRNVLKGAAFEMLPSGSTSFPMDKGYQPPEDSELYYGDLTVQRRMIAWRGSQGIHGAGTSWEEGNGTGLVAGIGSGICADGSNWEMLGHHVEATIQPMDEGQHGASSASSSPAAEKDVDVAAVIGSAGPQQLPAVALLAQAARVSSFLASREPVQSSVHNPDLSMPLAFAAAAASASSSSSADGQPTVGRKRRLESASSAASSSSLEGGSTHADDETARAEFADEQIDLDDEAEDEEVSGGIDDDDDEVHDGSSDTEADVLLRPRLGRGGRLVFDRIRRPDQPARIDLEDTMAEAQRLLHKRRVVLQDQREAAIAQWSGGVDADSDAVRRLAVADPSALTLTAAYRAAIEPSSRLRRSADGGNASSSSLAPTAIASKTTGVTTGYTLAPIDRGESATASVAAKARAAMGKTAALSGAPSSPHTPPAYASSLMAPELDEVLGGFPADATSSASSAGGEDGSNDVNNSSNVSGSGGVKPRLTLRFKTQAPAHQLAQPAESTLLRVAAMRFAAGYDAAPVIPKAASRKLAPGTGTVPEGRWHEIWNGDDSDDEELEVEEGVAGGRAADDSTMLVWCATLDRTLPQIPLNP